MHCGAGIKASLGLLLLTATSVAAAQGSGFYFGAGLGQSTLKIHDSDFNEDDTAFKLFGGIDLTENFAAEIAYVDGGKAAANSADFNGPFRIGFETTGIQASALGQLPLSPEFALFGRVGVFFWETKTTLSAPGAGTLVANDHGEDAFFGVGGAFDFGQGFGLRLEYNLGKIGPIDTQADFSTVLISGFYRFE